LTHDAIRSGAWRRDAPGDTRHARATSPVPTSPLPPVAATAPAASTATAAPSAVLPPIATDAPAVATPHPVAAPASIETTELPLAAAPAAAAAPSSAEPAPFSKPLAAAAPPDATARGWWVQLGAFRQRDGALGFQQRVAAELSWIAPLLALTEDRSLHRLQAGPYASRDEASAVAARVRDALRLVPVLVERR
jgi:rare lipoprotein A